MSGSTVAAAARLRYNVRRRFTEALRVNSKGPDRSLAWIAAALVLLIALLAGGALAALRLLHRQVAHSQAARSVVDQGRLIAAYLARQPIVRTGNDADWAGFSRQVHALHAAEDGLQYVSVTRDGVTVFYEQSGGLDGTPPPDDTAPPAAAGDVRMTLKLLTAGKASIPVVVFATQLRSDDGRLTLVEAAIRKETVDREERTASGAIASMFRLSLATVVVSFGICAALVVRLMRREARRERRRRREEHLAFAGVLADGIVHDFRNPMSSVRLDAQMLAREAERPPAPGAERIRELAGRIRHTVDRMDKVFQEFLYMSRPPSDERERVDLAACLRDCLVVLAPRFEQAGLKVETDLAPPGLAVLAYPAALQRALLNVLTNAEQFSPPGGAVRIRAAAAGDTATLEVMDAGPGVPAADRERIFEMFYSTRPGGTGLGLFLAKTAIERCGGAIEATNGPAGGACFRIRLPLAKERT